MLGKGGKVVSGALGVLVAIAIGAAVLTVLFQADGPFADITAATNTGALTGNAYSPIIVAIVALIPLGIFGGIGFMLYSTYGHKMRSGGGKKKAKKAKTRTRTKVVPIPMGGRGIR